MDNREEINKLYAVIKNNKLKQWEVAHHVFRIHELGEGSKQLQNNLYVFSDLKKSQSWISKAVNFFDAKNGYLINLVKESKISYSHGVLLMNQRKDRQKNLAQQVMINNISVANLEKLLKNKTYSNQDASLKYVEELFLNKGIRSKLTKSKIEIPYSNTDQLNNILDKLGIIED